jgi:glycosyltransferase 2 family protein
VNLQALRNRLLISLLLGLVVFAGLSIYADLHDVLRSLSSFNWALLPLILALTAGNYVFRFVKWEYYLRKIGVEGLSKRNSFLVFFSGLGMVITPGKVGEWLKSYLLREVHGTPIARSAPILIAERLTDTIALLIIAAAGVFVFGNLWQVFVIAAIGIAIILGIVWHRPTAHRFLKLGKRLPVARRFASDFEEFYDASYALLSPRAMIEMGLLSIFSWSFEVLGFYFTLVGIGLGHSGDLMLHSAFILPIATVASAISFAPGGLGVAEGSIQALSQTLLHLTKSKAAVATLIIRFGTLWFGVIVGLIAFAVLNRQLTKQGRHSGAEPLLATSEPLPGGPT